MRRFPVGARLLLLLACLVLVWPGWSRAEGPPKLGLSLYHFNVQFVAGDEVVANRIVTESISPLLVMYAKQPEWKFTFEIQAYGLEQIAENEPEVLELIRTLSERGQMELVVSHYSDQLLLAYPSDDYRKSLELSEGALERLELKRSRVFFAQEAQYGGAFPLALADDYDVVVTSGDPFVYFLNDTAHVMGYLEFGGKRMLALNPAGTADAQLAQIGAPVLLYAGDGEAANTGTQDNGFRHSSEKQRALAQRLRQAAEEGVRFCTITEFVDLLRERGYQPQEWPYLPEGTGGMQEGLGVWNWMGRLAGGATPDGATRALPYRARLYVLAAEALFAQARGRRLEVSAEGVVLRRAAEELMLAEVSDSSGWNPRPLEERYTAERTAAAISLGEQAIRGLLEKLQLGGEAALVTTDEPEVLRLSDLAGQWEPIPEVTETEAPPVEVAVSGAAHIYCQRMHPSRYELRIVAEPSEGSVTISFPVAGRPRYSPSLAEDHIVEVPAGLAHGVSLPIPNGWVYLGNGVGLIEHCGVRHLAALWEEGGRLSFREEFRKPETVEYRFTLFVGSAEEGHDLAQRMNVVPTIVLQSSATGLRLEQVTAAPPPPFPSQ